MTLAISTAAVAASHPLLSGPSPARASASSMEFVVSTPNAIGTRVAAAAAVKPCATADAMNSMCGVSPLIRQPRHTIASNWPPSAACRAATGTSNEPGTRTMVMQSAPTPAAVSAATAPACSRSVMKSWYFDTTIATRRPLAGSLASMVRTGMGSVSFEGRRSLLEKGGGALPHVVGGHRQPEERGLQCGRLCRRHLQSAVDSVENVAHRDRGVACELVGQCACRRHQLASRDDAVDEPDSFGLRGRNRRAGQQELHRFRLADQAREPIRATVTGHQPKRDLGLAEPGRVSGQPQCTGHRQLAATA